jgi:tRNA (cmo5U34)-methyltransferase
MTFLLPVAKVHIMDLVREAFNAGAPEYDAQRKWIIPLFEDFYDAAIRAAEWKGERPSILDIGAGTGLLAARILQRYPEASLTLIDISESMLAVARERFAGNEHLTCLVRDYSREEFGGPYDLICSALSIHHLGDDSKRSLYARIHEALNTGGVFVNAEQVEGETPEQHARYLAYWDTFLRKGPLPEEEWQRAVRRRDTLDRMAKLSIQLTWLREAGFSDIDVVFKNRSFAVMRGRKE